MTTPISLNTVVNTSFIQSHIRDYELDVETAAKYVVEMGGTANILVGVYGPFPVGKNLAAGTGNGKLRVCGVGKRGTRTLDPGRYLVQLAQNSAGSCTLKVRNWNFLDYFTIGFYKSSC